MASGAAYDFFLSFARNDCSEAAELNKSPAPHGLQRRDLHPFQFSDESLNSPPPLWRLAAAAGGVLPQA